VGLTAIKGASTTDGLKNKEELSEGNTLKKEETPDLTNAKKKALVSKFEGQVDVEDVTLRQSPVGPPANRYNPGKRGAPEMERQS
jgi:hypothetical protein